MFRTWRMFLTSNITSTFSWTLMSTEQNKQNAWWQSSVYMYFRITGHATLYSGLNCCDTPLLNNYFRCTTTDVLLRNGTGWQSFVFVLYSFNFSLTNAAILLPNSYSSKFTVVVHECRHDALPWCQQSHVHHGRVRQCTHYNRSEQVYTVAAHWIFAWNK